jgi:F-type H+-transporting ATPase subunit delta
MNASRESRKTARQLFKASFTDGKLDSEKVRNIVQTITAAKPRHYVDILKNYHRLIRLETEKHRALIESATPLSPETSNRVVRDLQRRYGTDLTTSFKINPDLIGGLRIKVGNDVWDASVANRLERLKEQFNRT